MNFLHEQSVKSPLSDVDDDVWRSTDHGHEALKHPEVSLVNLARPTTADSNKTSATLRLVYLHHVALAGGVAQW